jgi:hypothetical protein
VATVKQACSVLRPSHCLHYGDRTFGLQTFAEAVAAVAGLGEPVRTIRTRVADCL